MPRCVGDVILGLEKMANHHRSRTDRPPLIRPFLTRKWSRNASTKNGGSWSVLLVSPAETRADPSLSSWAEELARPKVAVGAINAKDAIVRD